MKALSLKLREDVFAELERIVRAIRIPRNAYINQALSFYTKLNRRKLLHRQLKEESKALGRHSLEVLEEFEKFEDDLIG